ncbi:ribosomal L1 domain-containing protein 1-like [Acropora millepora]|uniref:ribosomal L1 domain-containing protein 1-like n=1 Tax=Acropora millepora TaxID=45264 RepID=UPI001CF1B6D1|nr:ribosomal L1 domain-containing protein 1-like [Acropora millepora]
MAESTKRPKAESQLDVKQVEQAVAALLKYVSTKEEKPNPFKEHDSILLILALKKIPEKGKKPKQICLPHSLHSDKVGICLFAKDKNYSEMKTMLKENDVPVNKVIPYKKLKKKYYSFEAKRNLCALYDVFLCDEAIYHLLPQVLGKTFFSRKKYPVPIDLSESRLSVKQQIAGVIKCSLLLLGHGTCSAIKVAHTRQTAEEAVENVVAAVAEITKIVPQGWSNIQSLNLKTTDSVALPIYNSLPDNSSVAETSEPPKKKKKKKEE